MSHSQRIRRRRRQGGPKNKFMLAILVVVAAIGIASATLIGWVVNTAASAPQLATLKERNVGANTEILAADGSRLGFLQANDLSQPVAGKELPKLLKEATVAIEDERFFRHQGVDYEGIVRAAVKNFVSRKTVQGGSTITMQLVRNLYTGEKARQGLAGYQRKIREAKLAEELENEHPKSWILDKYLNTVPYGTVGGQTAIGAAAAARIYFDKPVSKLTLRQAALLAGLPQAPSAYGPFLHEAAATARRNEVLGKMADLGYITRDLAQRTMSRPLGVHFGKYFRNKRESYVFDYVKDELYKEYGPKVALSGLKVRTTIDLRKQEEARNAIAAKMGDIGPSSAVVTINPHNGYIEAMASSGKYDKSQFNLAAQGHRQPGSSFKVMALMTALRQGVDPDHTSYTSVSPTHIDDPVCGAPFDIKTYGGVGAGRLSLRQATLKSDNSVYIQLAADLGPDKIVQTAHDLGIRTKLNGYCAESLGGLTLGVSPLEMATAYATIADGGYRNRPTLITKITFPDGTHELPRRWRVHRVKAFSDGVTHKAVEILEQNIQAGTGTHANIGCPAGGKTGTTDRNTDAWFVGFTPRLATAVWVGYPNDRTEMNGLYFGANVDGGTFPADIWGAYMKQAKGSFCGPFPQPKEAFQASPFYGKYSRGAPKGGENGTSGTTGATTPAAPSGTSTPEPSAGTQNGTGGTQGFDPGAYESPPQGPPATTTPGNGGGGNGGDGTGTGGATPPGAATPGTGTAPG
jgi:penicillin-binding protein 1A